MNDMTPGREQGTGNREQAGGAAAQALPDVAGLLAELQTLIREARQRAAYAVNAEQTKLYWNIGNAIRKDILNEERAPYGDKIVATLSRQLTEEFGRGYSQQLLRHTMKFAEVFSDEKILSTLWRKLSWSHFRELMYMENRLKRDFYTEMCRSGRWSVRTLRERIGSMLFERTALSKKPDEAMEQEIAALRDDDTLTPDLVFRDPYLLDFLGLRDGHSERDLEDAILRELQAFLLELGTDFAFVARQKRITIDDEDFYIDLLFYHRTMRRLVAIELKIDKFTAAYEGQMKLYLRWLDRYEKKKGEEPPIGLILCSKKSPQQIELLQLDQGDIRVAEYMTQHLPTALLERKLQEMMRNAKERLALEAGREENE